MSVYHEALKSGRILHADRVRLGLRRALREVKQREADERNARTPYERTAQYRRDLERASR